MSRWKLEHEDRVLIGVVLVLAIAIVGVAALRVMLNRSCGGRDTYVRECATYRELSGCEADALKLWPRCVP